MWTQERFSYEGRLLLDARARDSAEADAEAASAAVGDGDEPRDGARRRRPRPRLPRRGRRQLTPSRSVARPSTTAASSCCDPVGAVNERVATLNFLYCHEDATEWAASDRPRSCSGIFGLLNAHLLSTREAYPTRAYQSLGNLAPAPGARRRRVPATAAPSRRASHRRSRSRSSPRSSAGSRSASTASTSCQRRRRSCRRNRCWRACVSSRAR